MKKGFLRHRRSATEAQAHESTPEESKEKVNNVSGNSLQSNPISWWTAFTVLAVSRWLSAKYNIIHDCDETFNYWEPLHYLHFGSGLQTWEYSSEFGLRSYLYLLLHGLVVAPAKAWFGSGQHKANIFFTLRVVLGGLSAASEASLVAAVGRCMGRRLSAYSLLLLCFASGCFTASTTFLPSTFSMYTLTWATALYLDNMPAGAVAVAAGGVLIGWPFSVLATSPLVLSSLLLGSFWKVFLAGAATSVGVLIPSILVDRYYYGRWTCSVLNLVIYNVIGGGDSALYGVEGPLFYLRNAANNFNLALPLALILPLIMLLIRKNGYGRLFLAVSPLYLWFGFMSMQSHKEERFLYIVYPHICVAAATCIEALPDLLPGVLKGNIENRSLLYKVMKWVRPLILGLILWLSYARTTALLLNYSAPMHIYSHIHISDEGSDITPAKDRTVQVCLGSEWHRFPSSFFLPSQRLRVAFLDDGFRGLLPFPFNDTEGGTSAAPLFFNNKNMASDQQFIDSESLCDYLVELDLHRSDVLTRGSNSSEWQLIKMFQFVDQEKSPPLYRAFHFPGISDKQNVFGDYRLLKRNVKHLVL